MAPRNRLVAALFAFIGGTIGLHKFYLRDSGGSVMYIFLMFFTMVSFIPITTILGFFDGIKLLGMSDEEFDRRYNRGFIQRNPQIERRRAEQLKRFETADTQKGFVKPPTRIRNNPFKASGMAKYKDFDLENAIDDFKEGLKIEPNDIALNFNIACAYSLTEKKRLAYEHLARAVQLGFTDFERIQTHDDLAYVRIQPEFEAFKQSQFRIVPQGIMSEPRATSFEEKAEEEEFKLEQLKKLESLYERGMLNDVDYKREKQRLIK